MKYENKLPCDYCSNKSWKWEERYCCMCGVPLPRKDQEGPKRSRAAAFLVIAFIWLLIIGLAYIIVSNAQDEASAKEASAAIYATERPDDFPWIIRD